MIKIVFFDGCGTLWYPRQTGRDENPVWIYRNPEAARDPDARLALTPSARATLQTLRGRGIVTALLSTSPHPRRHADQVLRRRVSRLGLGGLLGELHATAERHAAKGELITTILDRRRLSPREAIMVGDRHMWDTEPARAVGVRALLLRSAYEAEYIGAHPEQEIIEEVDGILDLLGGRS